MDNVLRGLARGLARGLIASLVLAIPGNTLAGQQSSRPRIVFGSDADFPPFEWVNPAGQPVGMNVDVMRALGRVMGFDVEIRLGPWSEIRRELEDLHSVDVSDMFYSVFRDSVVDFAEPFSVAHDRMYTRREQGATCRLGELEGIEIVAEDRAYAADILSRTGVGEGLVLVGSEPDALRLVASGRHDCAMVSQVTGDLIVRELGLSNLVPTGPPLNPRPYALVVREGRSGLLDTLNQGMEILRATGEYQAIEDRWIRPQGNDSIKLVLRVVLWVAALLLAGLLVVLGWSWFLRREVARRTRQHRVSEAAVLESRARLRALAQRLEEIREEEKASLSRELHDELGQSLTALRMDLSALRTQLPGEAGPARARLGELAHAIDDLVNELREICGRLRPPILDVLGLPEAIEWQVGELRKRCEVEFDLEMKLEGSHLERKTATVAFRLLQESLVNVLRHAGATLVRISLRREDGDLVGEVEDNGRGITPEDIASPTSLGLVGMRERVRSLDGHHSIEPLSGGGTLVRFRVPFCEAQLRSHPTLGN